MKAALVFLFVTASAFAQNAFLGPVLACGPLGTSIKVKLDNAQHALAPQAPGKAQVYFIHDAGAQTEFAFAYPTTKLAIDGSWVGAGHGNSWFEVPVEPGERHVCAALQSSVVDQRIELAHFTAEAGKTYFFRTRLVTSRSVELLELDRIDSDQGRYLVEEFPMSTFTAKK